MSREVPRACANARRGMSRARVEWCVHTQCATQFASPARLISCGSLFQCRRTGGQRRQAVTVYAQTFVALNRKGRRLGRTTQHRKAATPPRICTSSLARPRLALQALPPFRSARGPSPHPPPPPPPPQRADLEGVLGEPGSALICASWRVEVLHRRGEGGEDGAEPVRVGPRKVRVLDERRSSGNLG